MFGKRVLLRSSSPYIERRTSAPLLAAGNEVLADCSPEGCIAILELGGIDVVVVESSDGIDLTSLYEAAKQCAVPTILLNEALNSELLEAFCSGQAKHIAFGADRLEALPIAVEKLLRGSLFGIDKYQPRFGVEAYEFELRDGRSLQEALDCFDEFLGIVAAPPAMRDEIVPAVKELAFNALYSAPRNADGTRRYHASECRNGARVESTELVRLSYAFDGSRLLVSARDNFGSLLPSRIRSAIRRLSNREHIRPAMLKPRKRASLSSVWTAFSELIFNIAPGVQTEVICIRELDGVSRRCGLHLFHAGDEAPAPADGKESIEVSDSMLIDIQARHGARRRLPPVVLLKRKRRGTTPTPTPTTTALRSRLVARELPAGMDTLFGLLHGASNVQRTLEVGLGFMRVCYRGAIALHVSNDSMQVVLGAGEIHDWSAVRQLSIGLRADCRLADLVRSGLPEIYRPSPAYPFDFQITEMTVGPEGDPIGLILPILVHGETRYALLGFHARYGEHLSWSVVQSLSNEIGEAIYRHLSIAAPLANRRPETA